MIRPRAVAFAILILTSALVSTASAQVFFQMDYSVGAVPSGGSAWNRPDGAHA